MALLWGHYRDNIWLEELEELEELDELEAPEELTRRAQCACKVRPLPNKTENLDG